MLADLAAAELSPDAPGLIELVGVQGPAVEEDRAAGPDQGQGQLEDQGHGPHRARHGQVALVAVGRVATDELRALGHHGQAPSEARLEFGQAARLAVGRLDQGHLPGARNGQGDAGDAAARPDVVEARAPLGASQAGRGQLVQERQGQEGVEGVALGELLLTLDPGQVGPRVGVLEPGPELTDPVQGRALEAGDAGRSEGARELVQAEAQAGSTIAVMPPAQPALRGSGP